MRISMDLLRTGHHEKLFFELCLPTHAQIEVVKPTPSFWTASAICYLPKRPATPAIAYYFQLPLQQALSHKALRSGKAQSPEKGILGTLKQLQPPAFGEGFDRICWYSPTSMGVSA